MERNLGEEKEEEKKEQFLYCCCSNVMVTNRCIATNAHLIAPSSVYHPIT
jgi:hypothetical protein